MNGGKKHERRNQNPQNDDRATGGKNGHDLRICLASADKAREDSCIALEHKVLINLDAFVRTAPAVKGGALTLEIQQVNEQVFPQLYRVTLYAEDLSCLAQAGTVGRKSARFAGNGKREQSRPQGN
ncbi:MAG: hypothetical protein ACLR1P_08330 [Oscillospiraceae bacterium]